MLRQYAPQRFRYAETPRGFLPVGTVPVGTVFRCASEHASDRNRAMIVEAWLPREIGAGRRDHLGRYANAYVARGGHLAQVRCLATGRRKLLADHFIRFCVDHD